MDLEAALQRVADQVVPPTDDAVAGERLRAGVRRARGRRNALVGVAAALTIAAAGLGAATVWDTTPEPIMPAPAPSADPSPSATPAPTPTHRTSFPAPLAVESLFCGQPAPTPTEEDLLARVTVDDIAPSAVSTRDIDVAAHVSITPGARVSVRDPAAVAGYVLVADGAVVSFVYPTAPIEDAPTVELSAAADVALQLSVDSFAACNPDGSADESRSLPPGDYELSAVVPWTVSAYALEQAGSWGAPVEAAGPEAPLFDGWLVSEPVPFVVEPDPEAEDGTGHEDPETVVSPFTGPTTTFPENVTFEELECGMPAPEPTGDDLLARLIVPGSVRMTAGSSTSVSTSLVGHASARTESVDFLWMLPYVVVQDGRIVSSTRFATDSDGISSLDAGQALPLEYAIGPESMCNGGMPAGGNLPPGEYSVHAILPWIVASYSLQQPDGSWGPTNVLSGEQRSLSWLVSEPVALTIE
ncbi:hypothetical protein [Cellulosimicrobium cellulans]|uniref:hypothetical protein n=1 Tax=Cellulosimicrobium cellulans TaxID=1710 RepID=UPI001112D133|nr:hypothetical protein [Cellulosimicrobium cellulans]